MKNYEKLLPTLGIDRNYETEYELRTIIHRGYLNQDRVDFHADYNKMIIPL